MNKEDRLNEIYDMQLKFLEEAFAQYTGGDKRIFLLNYDKTRYTELYPLVQEATSLLSENLEIADGALWSKNDTELIDAYNNLTASEKVIFLKLGKLILYNCDDDKAEFIKQKLELLNL
jgi:hypothetical protein